MMGQDDIAIITLPVARWREFRELRLEALQDSPQAFAAPHEEEMAYPDELWIERLQEAQESKSVALFAEHDDKLVGMIGAFFEAGPEVATVVAVFVNPDYRAKGVGHRLVQGVLDRLRAMPETQRARLMVNVDQTPAVELYRRAGFVEVGKERLELGDGRVYDELVLERELS